MNTKERAIAAVAALRDRYVSHHAPPALNEELVDAVLEAIRDPGDGVKIDVLMSGKWKDVPAGKRQHMHPVDSWQAFIYSILKAK